MYGIIKLRKTLRKIKLYDFFAKNSQKGRFLKLLHTFRTLFLIVFCKIVEYNETIKGGVPPCEGLPLKKIRARLRVFASAYKR